MVDVPLKVEDIIALGRADNTCVRNALSRLRSHSVPPWLDSMNPYPSGNLPKRAKDFVEPQHLIEIIAIRGPLHAIDGWSYIARALNSLISGNSHAARHLAYYAELRGALSILASSGIGIFNKRNVVIDVNGVVHTLSERPTHDMCWAAISQWAMTETSFSRVVDSIYLAGTSLLDPFRTFFPSGATLAASNLLNEWGFDLAQGTQDRDERNWSSYQPTALAEIRTTPDENREFLTMFWDSLRPSEISLERHLLRILLETEASVHGASLSEYEDRYDYINDSTKIQISFEFLMRATERNNHKFLVHASNINTPAHPYSMICRAALLLRLATGMAEKNLSSAGIQPYLHFENWWREFGLNHGLWPPNDQPETSYDLWNGIEGVLEEVAATSATHRHEWISQLRDNAMRVCEAERAALWGLFR